MTNDLPDLTTKTLARPLRQLSIGKTKPPNLTRKTSMFYFICAQTATTTIKLKLAQQTNNPLTQSSFMLIFSHFMFFGQQHLLTMNQDFINPPFLVRFATLASSILKFIWSFLCFFHFLFVRISFFVVDWFNSLVLLVEVLLGVFCFSN